MASDESADRYSTPSGEDVHKASAFDIRTFIAALIGIYGIVLVLTGLFGTSDADLEMTGGTNVNLWAGAGMIVFAAAFIIWARLRPVVVPADPPADEGAPPGVEH